MPVNTLKKVVLPAPLGPMMDAIVPSASAKSTAFSAVSPPNRLVMPCASRTTPTPGPPSLTGARELAMAAARGQKALGAEDHHQDQDQAEDHALVLRGLELRREIGQAEAQDRH